MEVSYIARESLSQFSAFSKAFKNQQRFEAFLQAPFERVEQLNEQAELKSQQYSKENRKVLVDTLTAQLEDFASEQQRANLALLASENTFSITTGHQLTLFGGPLYLIYKVLHVVKLVEAFNANHTSKKAVPIFWMASEDHDIDEVRSTALFQQKFIWETQQTGAVGRMGLSDFDLVFQAFGQLFEGKETAIKKLLAIPRWETYADYCQQFLSVLFADFGVLVIQPDAPSLKKLFAPVIKRELFSQPSLAAVSKTNELLAKAGWNPQAKARSVNLFYLSQGERQRIDPTENGFAIGGELIPAIQMEAMIENDPASFSPNVILRPVYQETILPNLAYIGGGGEMAYWIQLKGVFEAHETLFPLIQQRNSMHLVDHTMMKRMEKVEFELVDYFKHKDVLKNQFLAIHGEEELDLTAIHAQFDQLRLAIIEKAKSVSVTLESFAEAETVRMSKQLEAFESKLSKQVKQQHEQSLKAIEFVCDRFLPQNTLQERYYHWLQFAPTGEFPLLLQAIYAATDPFQADLIVCTWDETEKY